jgi:hypothetical protein
VIRTSERRKLLAVRVCGPRVVERLESIGVRRLADLVGRDPWDVMHEINLEAGRTIWRPPMAILALQNMIDVAERDSRPRDRRVRSGGSTPTS